QATLLVAHVCRPYHPRPAILSTDPEGHREAILAVQQEREAAGRRLLEDARARLTAAGRRTETVLREGDPTEQLQALAAERGADLILAGARGASLIEGLLVGSVADRLLKSPTCSVLLVH